MIVFVGLAISVLTAGCDSEEADPSPPLAPLKLPMNQGFDGGDCEPTDLTLHDVNYLSDLVVVGTISKIEVVRDEIVARGVPTTPEECNPGSQKWATRVTMGNLEIVRGESTTGTVEFILDYDRTKQWQSLAMTKVNDEWVPGWVEPTIELSETFAWSGDTGLQPGQRLGVFLEQNDGRYVLNRLPMLEAFGSRVRPTTKHVFGRCYTVNALTEATVSELRTSLTNSDASLAGQAATALRQYPIVQVSSCSPPTEPDLVHDMDLDADQ